MSKYLLYFLFCLFFLVSSQFLCRLAEPIYLLTRLIQRALAIHNLKFQYVTNVFRSFLSLTNLTKFLHHKF